MTFLTVLLLRALPNSVYKREAIWVGLKPLLWYCKILLLSASLTFEYFIDSIIEIISRKRKSRPSADLKKGKSAAFRNDFFLII